MTPFCTHRTESLSSYKIGDYTSKKFTLVNKVLLGEDEERIDTLLAFSNDVTVTQGRYIPFEVWNIIVEFLFAAAIALKDLSATAKAIGRIKRVCPAFYSITNRLLRKHSLAHFTPNFTTKHLTAAAYPAQYIFIARHLSSDIDRIFAAKYIAARTKPKFLAWMFSLPILLRAAVDPSSHDNIYAAIVFITETSGSCAITTIAPFLNGEQTHINRFILAIPTLDIPIKNLNPLKLMNNDLLSVTARIAFAALIPDTQENISLNVQRSLFHPLFAAMSDRFPQDRIGRYNLYTCFLIIISDDNIQRQRCNLFSLFNSSHLSLPHIQQCTLSTIRAIFAFLHDDVNDIDRMLTSQYKSAIGPASGLAGNARFYPHKFDAIPLLRYGISDLCRTITALADRRHEPNIIMLYAQIFSQSQFPSLCKTCKVSPSFHF